jgi:peroxiredoxin
MIIHRGLVRFVAAGLVCAGVAVSAATPRALVAGPLHVAADPPKVGDKAPDFTLAGIDGKKITLSAELQNGPVVVIVGRGWVGYQCPFCNRQFGDFSKSAPEIEAAGARVIWVYPGPTESVQQRATEFAAGKAFPPNFRFVLDPNYTFTVSYALRWDAPQETAYPSTFVIDRAGVVRYAVISRTHSGRATAADVLGVLAGMGK